MGKPTKEELKKDFDATDVDGSGFLTVDDLKKIAAKYEVEVSEEELAANLAKIDSSGDGKISFDEFCKATCG